MPIHAKKSLGQNFLKSKEAIRSIIDAGELSVNDTVLEIGPGKGVLTEELVKNAGKVLAIEKDQRLIPVLQEQFSTEIAAGKLEIREGDVLELNPETLKSEIISKDAGYKLIANIPYYITGILFRTFLESSFAPQKMVVLVQKEVAQRIVARDEKESLLSISVKAYGTPKYIQTVKAKYFSPQPKVDSAIISIHSISKKFFDGFSEQHFFDVVRAGFAHKRKMLSGNLKDHFENVSEALEKANILPTVRAEDIKLEDWKRLVPELAIVKRP